MWCGHFADVHPHATDSESHLLRFCPRFAAELAQDAVPQSVKLRGSMMIVDISGFTRKSAALGAAGRVGIDELRNVTRDILATYLNVIEHYDGEVVAFAGDALICLFHTSDRHTMQAVRCAFELKDYAASGLTTHAAVVTGEVSVAILGGYEDRWSYLVGGECLDILGQCLDAAHSSQLVICGETFEKVKKYITNSEDISNGLFRVNSLRSLISTTPRAVRTRIPSAAVLNRFIPAPILSAIAANTVDDLAELRVVSTLFLKLDSFASAANDLMSLQPLFFNYQCIISECGGMLRQFLVDDKGCVLIVVFGVPTAMHLSNCCRAVRCAALLMERTRSMSHVCSIGITTGKAYCGLIGSSSRQEYVVMGKVVNLAARLMSRAEGGLLTDAATYACLRDDAAQCFEEKGSIELKGFDKRVVFYRLITAPTFLQALESYSSATNRNVVVCSSASSALLHLVPLCREMKNTTRDDDKMQRPHVCILHGAPGYGKSIAVQKYCDELSRQDLRYARLRIRANLKKNSLAIMMLHAIVVVFAPTSDHDNFLKVVHSLIHDSMGPTKAATILQSLCDVLMSYHTHDWSISKTRDISMQQRAYGKYGTSVPDLNCTDDILLLVQFAATQYGFSSIIVEGVEHLSMESWNQLQSLAVSSWSIVLVLSVAELDLQQPYFDDDSDLPFSTPRTHSMLVQSRSLSTHSVEEPEDIIDDSNMAKLMHHSNTTYVHLACTTYDEVCLSVKASLAEELPDSVISRIYQLSRGNHYWLTLLIQYVAKVGINEFNFMMSNVERRDVLATATLSRLKDKQYHIAKVASVIGIDFELSTLRSILPAALQINLKRSMDELVDKDVLQMIGLESYSFQSTLLRDLIYQLIPPSNVSAIHLDVAKAMEAVNGDPAMIIYHYFHCEKTVRHRGFSYGLRAASEALQAAHFSLTIHYLFMTLRVSHPKQVYIDQLLLVCKSTRDRLGLEAYRKEVKDLDTFEKLATEKLAREKVVSDKKHTVLYSHVLKFML